LGQSWLVEAGTEIHVCGLRGEQRRPQHRRQVDVQNGMVTATGCSMQHLLPDRKQNLQGLQLVRMIHADECLHPRGIKKVNDIGVLVGDGRGCIGHCCLESFARKPVKPCCVPFARTVGYWPASDGIPTSVASRPPASNLCDGYS